MPVRPTNPVHDVFATALILILVVAGAVALLRFLRRTRPDLPLGPPLAVGLGIRVLITSLLVLVGPSEQFRGGDEAFFLDSGRRHRRYSVRAPTLRSKR